MAKKRSNMGSTARMEQILVADATTALATGALVGATTALGITNGQLGIMSADLDGTIAAGNMITAATTAAQVGAIQILQGTPKSAAIHKVNPFEVGDKGKVETGIIGSDMIQSVSTVTPKVERFGASAYVVTPTIVADTEYSVYVTSSSVRKDRDYGDNDDVIAEVYTSPTTLPGSPKDGVVQNLAYKINARGNKDVLALAIDVAGGTTTAATGTLTMVSAIATDTVTVNGLVYTGVAGAKADNTEFSIDTSDTAAATDLADSITNDTRDPVTVPSIDVTASSALGVVTVTAAVASALGNDIDMSATGGTVTPDAATLTGGAGWAIGTLATGSEVDYFVKDGVTYSFTMDPGMVHALAALVDNTVVTATSAIVPINLTAAGTLGSDCLVCIGIPHEEAAYFDNIEQKMVSVEINPGDGFIALAPATVVSIRGEEGTGHGKKWDIEAKRRYQLTVHTMQNQPMGEFFSQGASYISTTGNYTSSIIDYYGVTETITDVQPHPKQSIILIPAEIAGADNTAAGGADLSLTTVSAVATQIGAGTPAYNLQTLGVIPAALEASLGAWIESSTSPFTVGGQSAKGGSLFDV